MKINFSSRLFNPLYWHIRKYKKDPAIRYILIYGGSSAAKTYSVVQSIVVDTFDERDNYMVLRKYGSDIEDSIYSDFTGVIDTWNVGGMFHCVRNRIKNAAGGYVRFRGLDDSEKIKGISRFKRVVMEEMNQFAHEDYKQLRKRLRGRPGQQIIGMWNPVSEEHWIKTEIIDKQTWYDLPKSVEGIEDSELSEDSFIRINEEGNTVLMKTTFQDNYWIVGHHRKSNVGFRDLHVLADFEADKKFDYAYYRVYALGEWGKIDSGAEFYKTFNTAVNVGKVQYNPELPLHLSFDENVNPYITCTIYQAEGNKIRAIDEVAMTPPNNTLQHMLTEIEKRYMFHSGGMFIYGDATSRKEDVKLEKGYNFFSLIVRGLEKFHPSTRVPLANPPVMIRGMFINDILRGKYEDVEIIIGENCRKIIEDLRYVKEAADGTKLKEKVKDPRTGVTYEPHGHMSDTLDYFICQYLNPLFVKFQHGSSTSKRVAIRAYDATNF